MMNCILAENLKHRHSFLGKLLFIAPFLALLSSLIFVPSYFTISAYNWWYVILMPATFALIPALMHRREERKLNYRAIFPLDIDLRKLWLAKIVTALVYMAITLVIHMLAVFLFQSFLGQQLGPAYSFTTLLFASVILLVSNIWQLPFCFFLAKEFGFITSITVNAVFGLTLGILLSDSSAWLFCPYSWGIRSMVPILHILPNGLLADASDPMLANTSIIIPCLLSIALFALLTFITANWFSKQEVN